MHGALPKGGPGAKPARSIVRVVARCAADAVDPDRTIVEVRIPTGRAHQIRIHMAYLGHPLVGDPLYVSGGQPRPAADALLADAPSTDAAAGVAEARPPLPRDCGYHLHAWRVELPHPTSGERVSFEAPPPPSLCAEPREDDEVVEAASKSKPPDRPEDHSDDGGKRKRDSKY